jgi:hypothetical protein
VLCGAGSLNWVKQSWPTNKDSTFDGRIWDPKFSELPISELPISELPISELPISELPISELPSPESAPDKFQSLGPFKHAYDFFGDWSFFLVDASGQCEGNLAGMKTKAGRTKWAFLGGDCFHSIHFARYPEVPFGEGVKVASTDSYHEDEVKAKDFTRQTAELKLREGNDALIGLHI